MPRHQIHKPGIWLGDDEVLDVDALFLGVLSSGGGLASGGGLGGPADEGEGETDQTRTPKPN